MADVRPFVNRHRSGVTFVVLILASLLLVGLFPPPGQVGLLSLVQASIGSVSRWVGDTVNSISELRRSRAEVQRLRSVLSRMELRTQGAVELEADNLELRTLLSLNDTVPAGSIPASVIGRDPGSLFETVAIDRGRRHGVRVDASVVASAAGFQALVGRVESTTLLTAIVRPVLDRKSFVAARLQRTRHDGIIEGDPQGGRLIMRWVSLKAEEELAIGDLVITSGMRSLYPRGIYIGRVSETRRSKQGDSIELIVQPLVEFGRLDYVVVRIPETPNG